MRNRQNNFFERTGIIVTETTARHDSDKRVIRTKKAIKAALFRIMEDKDISSITISELSQQACVNRRTFYMHYRNITDILDETESELVESLSRLVERFDASDFKKSTYDLFIGLNDLITVEFDYYFHLVRVDMRGMLVSRLKSVIKASTDQLLERVSSSNSASSKVVSSFIVGGFFNTYLEWHGHPDEIPIDTVANLAGYMVEMCVENMNVQHRL